MLITGDSGSGKSSLLANWWRQKSTSNHSRPIFVHFVGASTLASNFSTILLHLFEEINSHLKEDKRLPLPNDKDLVKCIPKFFEAISISVCI